MVNRMVLNNLGYRPVRTALSVLAVLIEVLLILSVVGLVHGLLQERAERQRGIGADILVRSSNASSIMGLSSGAQLPVSLGRKLKEVTGVTAVTPVYWQSQGGLTLAWGIDAGSFDAVSGGFTVQTGRTIRPVEDLPNKPCCPVPANKDAPEPPCDSAATPCEMVVDDVQAAKDNLQVGQDVEMWGNKFRLVGVVASGKGARIYVPLSITQDLNAGEGRCTLFYIRIADPDKGLAPVIERMKAMLPGYNIDSMRDVYSQMISGNIPGVDAFQTIMIAIAVTIGFLVIFMALYTAVLERTREIGTLKAMGASKGYIVGLILRETALIAVFGAILGIVAFVFLRRFVMATHPDLSIQISLRWIIIGTLIAIAGAMFGAAYPALRAAKHDPIEALAYE